MRPRLMLTAPGYFLLNLQQRGYLNVGFLAQAVVDRVKRVVRR
jgi:hypothetical protein